MTIFLVLIGMGVVFLLYVLANFWQEGRRSKTLAQMSVVISSLGTQAEVVAITPPISLSASGNLSVMPFPVSSKQQFAKSAESTTAHRMIEMPVKKFSTR